MPLPSKISDAPDGFGESTIGEVEVEVEEEEEEERVGDEYDDADAGDADDAVSWTIEG